MAPPDDFPPVPVDEAPDPMPEYKRSNYGKDRVCDMTCCASIVLDDNEGVVHPLTYWLEREATKERRATLQRMLIPLGVTTGRGIPRYTCANLDDSDPEHLVCRAFGDTPDWCSPTPDRQPCVAGPCWTCGMSMGPGTDKRKAKASFVSPLPAVNSQHILGNLPIGLLPRDEQRIEER